jgi:uncharacterized membrane protein (UPF0127 family)
MKEYPILEFFFNGTPVMHFADIPVRVEIANSDEERKQGLSGRKEFGKKVNGLLFVFPETDYHKMWMKDMHFAIDIIWIGEDLKVINIEKNVSPETYPKTFRPDRPARYAVETETHYSDLFGIRAGMEVKLPPNYLEH